MDFEEAVEDNQLPEFLRLIPTSVRFFRFVIFLSKKFAKVLMPKQSFIFILEKVQSDILVFAISRKIYRTNRRMLTANQTRMKMK